MLLAPALPVFSGPRAQALTFPNKGLSELNTSAPSWSDVSYGADAQSERLCGIIVTGEEPTSGLISVDAASWGGVTLPRLDSISIQVSNLGIYAGIFAAKIPTGSSGTISLTLDETWDSVGVTTFVTTELANGTLLDSATETTTFQSSIVADNVDVASNGIVLGACVGDIYTTAFTSMTGDTTGAVTEQYDAGIENDHRQGVYGIKTTSAVSADDFTFVRAAAGYWACVAVSMH